MKGNKKLLVVAILLLVIAVSYSTYAIYKSSASGTATVNAAKWNIEFLESDASTTLNTAITFTSADCGNNTHVAANKVAPGITCSKQVVLDANDTEVDVQYSVTAGTPNISGTDLSQDQQGRFSASVTDGGTGTITHGASGRTATLTVTLTWAGAANDSDATNLIDVSLQGATITVPLTLTAVQVL